MKFLTGILAVLFFANAEAQVSDSVKQLLSIDTSYAFFQYGNPELAASLQKQLKNTGKDKFVIYHYGGSHIQAGMPPKIARRYLQSAYGDGGNGMLFSYGAANTYSSVLYASTQTGSWKYAKSFMGELKVPLGVAGMGVETEDSASTLSFRIKEPWKKRHYLLRILTEADSLNYHFTVKVNGFPYPEELLQYVGGGIWQTDFEAEITDIQVMLSKNDPRQTRFRFYGIDIESYENSGIVYHSLGVGAAPMRSVLRLEKMPEESAVLKPDMVLLDFGTNDILYTNSIDKSLAGQVERAIAEFRKVNPGILVVLTSPQDLYRKKRYISAGVEFVKLMDSLAKKNNCFFWNWYDLSGGYGKITTWHKEGYAKSDFIHLTPAGYDVKGYYLFRSIENTLNYYAANKSGSLYVEPKGLPEKPIAAVPETHHQPAGRTSTYTVRSGDTLSQIAARQHTTVSKIKAANGLRSDRISIGQRLKIPR